MQILAFLYSMLIFPLVIYLTVNDLLKNSIATTDFIVVTIIFAFHYTLMQQMLAFAIPGKWPGRISLSIDIFSFVLAIQSVFAQKINPW